MNILSKPSTDCLLGFHGGYSQSVDMSRQLKCISLYNHWADIYEEEMCSFIANFPLDCAAVLVSFPLTGTRLVFVTMIYFFVSGWHSIAKNGCLMGRYDNLKTCQ